MYLAGQAIRSFVRVERISAEQPFWIRDQLMTDEADALRRDITILAECEDRSDEENRILDAATSLIGSYVDAL